MRQSASGLDLETLHHEIKEYSKFEEDRVAHSLTRLWEDLIFFIKSIPQRSRGTMEKNEAEWQVVSDLIDEIKNQISLFAAQLKSVMAEITLIDQDIANLKTAAKEQSTKFQYECDKAASALSKQYHEEVADVEAESLRKQAKWKQALRTIESL